MGECQQVGDVRAGLGGINYDTSLQSFGDGPGCCGSGCVSDAALGLGVLWTLMLGLIFLG